MKKQIKNILEVEKVNHWPVSVWMVLGLLFLNAILAWPLMLDGFTRYIESIEGAHMVNAAWIINQGGQWNDQWYFGFPAHLTYPPLLPNLIAFIVKFGGLTVSHAYRITLGVLIWLIPLGIYIFTRELTKRKTVAVLAGLMFIVMPNIAYLIIPQIQTLPSASGWVPYHWLVFAKYGEGPHLAALFFMLISSTYFLKNLDSQSKKNIVGAALFLALTMLTNLFAGLALLLIMVILQLGRMFIYVFDINWRRLVLITLMGYGLTAFAFDFTFIQSILKSGYIHPENTVNWPPFLVIFFVALFLIVPLTLLIYHMIVSNDKYYPVTVMMMWTGLFLLVAAVYYYFDYNLLTQPNRYLHEAQIGAAVLIAMGMTFLIDNARQTDHEEERFTKHLLVTIGIFVFIFGLSFNYLKNPHWIIAPHSMEKSYEKEIAEELDKIIDEKTGERVYLTGTPSFWLNVFTDVPQIRGGADNAQPNGWWADAAYQINKSDNEQLTKAWLNLLNVKYILVNSPESGTHYVDYDNPERFADWKLADQFAEGGYQLFEVPDVNLSLFSVVKTAELNQLKNINKSDPESIINLANLISGADNNRIKFEKLNAGQYKLVVADLAPDETIVFKMNYDERWQAKMEYQQFEIESIGPNFMAITPGIGGEVEIDWSVNRSKWEIIGVLITILTVILTVNWLRKK